MPRIMNNFWNWPENKKINNFTDFYINGNHANWFRHSKDVSNQKSILTFLGHPVYVYVSHISIFF